MVGRVGAQVDHLIDLCIQRAGTDFGERGALGADGQGDRGFAGVAFGRFDDVAGGEAEAPGADLGGFQEDGFTDEFGDETGGGALVDVLGGAELEDAGRRT